MQPRLIKGLQAEYVRAPWTGHDTSGLKIYGDNMLVRVDACSPKTSGGIELPMDMVEKMTEASEMGVLCAIGPQAFHLLSNNRVRWESEKPRAGERIVFAKYAGTLVMGADGAVYRIMESSAIVAGLPREAEVAKAEEAA